MIHHHHNSLLVGLSIVIAIFSSYVALDLANGLTLSKGKGRWVWLSGGSLAMGIGIWSMHFVAMLAFSLPGIAISYDVSLLIWSIVVAVFASAFALILVSRETISSMAYLSGSLSMGAAIAGMHYLGIASMKLAADIHWNMFLVAASIVIAVVASFVALHLAFKLRHNHSKIGYLYRGLGGVVMGLAISGMHYTAMAAMSFTPANKPIIGEDQLLATHGLAVAVIIATFIILCIALSGTIIDRELSRRNEMNAALRTAIRTRDEFLSIASHELKTPLTTIKLQVQLVLRTMKKMNSLQENERAKFSGMMNQAEKSVDRLTRLVDDMLDISRISRGKLTLQMEEFNLSEMIQDVVERLGNLLAEANCEVQIKKVDDVVGTWDKFRIEQVVTNLLTNAARYGSGHPIEVKVSKEQGSAKICVKDFGIGIASEDKEKIFQRFERASHVNEIKGLGLGLYIVKEILNMHQGSIEVESELGKGSEFIVRLPLKEHSASV